MLKRVIIMTLVAVTLSACTGNQNSLPNLLSFDAKWDGVSDNISGVVTPDDDPVGTSFYFSIFEEGIECAANIHPSIKVARSGKWNFGCADRFLSSGTWAIEPSTGHVIGSGTDRKSRKVTFVISPMD